MVCTENTSTLFSAFSFACWGNATTFNANSLIGTFLSTTNLASVLVIWIIVVVVLVQFHFIIGKKKHSRLPLGPPSWPIVGNIPDLLRKKSIFRWIEKFMKEMKIDIACIKIGNVHVIPVTSPEIAREFLKKQDATFASRPITMGTEYSSRGFLTIAVAPWGDQWKKMRSVVASQLLSPGRLRWLLEKREEEADNLVRYVYKQCICGCAKNNNGSAIVDVRKTSRAYSVNVIRRLMFNTRYFGEGQADGGPGPEEEEHVEALFTVLSLLFAFNLSDYLPRLRALDLDGHEKIIRAATKIVNNFHDDVIDRRIKQWKGGNDDELVMKKEPEDLLDILVSLKDENGEPLLTTDEIKAQSAELMYASVDNPSNAIEWALAEMINQPEILQKAVNEIDIVVGKDRLVQESDFSKLNYVKACAREAFRLHPVAPFNLPHLSNADATIAGYFIPKGSHVLLSRRGLGRNPKIWEDPLKFNPERHLNGVEVELTENELRFISFSTGRRGCMGIPLGSAMTVMLLARLLQGFNWSVPPGESNIDLTESSHDLFLAKPLHAYATPRLTAHVYPQLRLEMARQRLEHSSEKEKEKRRRRRR